MSPIVWQGGSCVRCHKRPAWLHNLCSSCYQLLKACGEDPVAYDPELEQPEPISRFQALCDMGKAFPSNTLEFDRALADWLGRAA